MSFFENYRLYCSGNETPVIYNEWCALSALAAIVSRKVWLPFGYYDIHPNLYTVLVGPPAAHKTTAMSTAKRLVRAMKDIKVAPTSTTREALIRIMAENQMSFTDESVSPPKMYQFAPLMVCVSELSEFLTISKENMIGFLTAIWDEPFFEYKTKNKGINGESNEDIIHGPILTLLAGTTPSWITQYLKSDVISGGFSRRAMFVYSDGPDHRIPIPYISPEQMAAWDDIVAVALDVKKIKGAMSWGTGTRDWWNNWYHTRDIPKDPVVAGYHGSKPDLVLKLGMLHALAERKEKVLQVEDLVWGLRTLDWSEKDLNRILGGVGRNELAGALSVFWNCINCRQGEISEKELRTETYSTVQDREYIEVVNHLLKIGAWRQITKDGAMYYVTPDKYKKYQDAQRPTKKAEGEAIPTPPPVRPPNPFVPPDATDLSGPIGGIAGTSVDT